MAALDVTDSIKGSTGDADILMKEKEKQVDTTESEAKNSLSGTDVDSGIANVSQDPICEPVLATCIGQGEAIELTTIPANKSGFNPQTGQISEDEIRGRTLAFADRFRYLRTRIRRPRLRVSKWTRSRGIKSKPHGKLEEDLSPTRMILETENMETLYSPDDHCFESGEKDDPEDPTKHLSDHSLPRSSIRSRLRSSIQHAFVWMFSCRDVRRSSSEMDLHGDTSNMPPSFPDITSVSNENAEITPVGEPADSEIIPPRN